MVVASRLEASWRPWRMPFVDPVRALRLQLLPLVTLAMLFATPASAHPHGWIDLRSKVLLDDDGRVNGLQLYWLFDDWYTIYIAEEFAKSGQESGEYLNSLAEENLASLKEYNYFTKVFIDGNPVKTGEVTVFETGLSDERLWLRFDVPLGRPVDPKPFDVSYKIYDPTYYIEILHDEKNAVTFSGEGADACSAKVVDANPSFEAVALASALDFTENGGDNLGEVFAQTVDISCR